jgi:multiple antibiotic resistance protein
MTEFWLCFVPLFVAVDAFGILPLFIGMVEGMDRARTRKVILLSLATALAVSLLFAVGGPFLLGYLGVQLSDFLIAGGILLFIFSIIELLAFEQKAQAVDGDLIGAVPLGVPIVAGPAVLTTVMLLASRYSEKLPMVVGALALNIAIVGLVLFLARPLHRLIGRVGAKTASKVSALLLATYAVMLVRNGVVEVMKQLQGIGGQ